MTPKRRRAVKRRTSTTPAPGVEELLGIHVDRRRAFEGGHLAALFDELTEARLRAMPSTLGADPQETDPVTLPFWAFEAVASLVESEMISGSRKRGRHARWWRQYREDLIQWHRYALVRQRLGDATAGWPDNATGLPDVFSVVSRELERTVLAARRSTVKKSYETVAAALKRKEFYRYYRSTAAHVYDFLLGAASVPPNAGAGANYGHLYIKSLPTK